MNPTLKGSHLNIEVRPFQGRIHVGMSTGGGVRSLSRPHLPPAIILIPSGDFKAVSQYSVLLSSVVCAERGDAVDRARLDDVGREAVAVDAARVEAERARPASRPLGGPVAE